MLKKSTLKNIEHNLKKIKQELENRYKIKEIGIFGSFVRGEQKENSDVDVIVEFYETPSLLKFIEIENYLTEILSVKVDLVRRKAIRAELKDTIMQEVIFI